MYQINKLKNYDNRLSKYIQIKIIENLNYVQNIEIGGIWKQY